MSRGSMQSGANFRIGFHLRDETRRFACLAFFLSRFVVVQKPRNSCFVIAEKK